MGGEGSRIAKGWAMKLVSFEIDGQPGYGVLDNDAIARMDNVAGEAPTLKSALELQRPTQWRREDLTFDLPLSSVTLLPPIPDAGKILCVATNYLEPHNADKPLPEYPIVFTRFADSFTGHGQPLIKPCVSERYDFEGELAVIIGQPGFHISAEDAMQHVAGYCCLNDGSVRDWQKHSTQFTPGKNFYRSASMGPWMVTADEIPDLSAGRLQTRVNGVVKQQIGFDRMIFSIPWLIAYFSTFTPLSPGDVIATGTPSGFGSTRNPPEFLSASDVIEIEISGLGTLTNSVAGEAA